MTFVMFLLMIFVDKVNPVRLPCLNFFRICAGSMVDLNGFALRTAKYLEVKPLGSV